jgi:hypothetical protein
VIPALIEVAHLGLQPVGELGEEGQAEGGGGRKGVAVEPVPFPYVGLKKSWAIPFWSWARVMRQSFPVRSMRAWRRLSALTPRAMRGGWKEAWVTQFTVPAATSSPSWAVRM